MSYVKTIFSRHTHFLHNKPFINPNKFTINPSFFFTTHVSNSFFHSTKPQKSAKNDNLESKNKRTLDIVFKEFWEKEQTLVNFGEEKGENSELVKKLWDLEVEIRDLKSKSPSIEENVGNLEGFKGKCGEDEGVSKAKPRNLVTRFSEKKKDVIFGEISEDMQLLLRHLYDCGYFKDANFLPVNQFDMSCFYEEHAREYVKFALQRFGNDHKEIAVWLSGSDAKSVAQFGCPSVIKGDVFAAKKLRSFFTIKEETVCRKCVLKKSCMYADKSAGEGCSDSTLRLDSLLRLLRAYSLEEISPRLKLRDHMKACVSRLIHEVINLTTRGSC